MNKVKFFALISILCLMIIIPTSFAVDSEAAVAVDEPVDSLALTAGGSDILASDWYFDSNAENDGNGSITNPYKMLSSNRIVSDSNLHLANGEYYLAGYSSINNVTIIGDNPSLTILRYSGKHFSGSSSLTLSNLTLVNLRVINSNLTASNVIFKDSQYSSSSGGVIESQSENCFINLDNCTFSNNYAKYGGAIYLKKGTLTVTNSLFMDNHANLYGGSIVGYEKANIYINDSKFLNSYSIGDAGGAIYLFDSNLMAYNLEINNCSSTFGGAIISLKSSLNLNNFTGKNNKAKYDGGAVYAMYRIFHMNSSLLENNDAANAGAVFVYNIADFLISNTQFIENSATNAASAFYSVYLQDPYYDSILHPALNNTFSNNNPCENDVLEVDLPDLFIGNNNFTLYKSNFSDIDTIPSSYDLRDLGQVSSVKNQGNDGNCWAFASLGALESSILKSTGIEFDFSEQNMKNLMSLYSAYGWNMETNDGGYSKMALGYLVSWLGPIDDNGDNYKLDTALSPVLNSIMHIQNILFLKRDNYTDNDEIKLAIMKYGGVAAPMRYVSSYIKDKKNYYYTGNDASNHLVVIVGWDDNYSKSNFKSTPSGDGAWIIKNSWGPNVGENGYYYVSYYDTRLAKVSDYEPFVFVLNDTIKYDKNYQYDIPGVTDYFLNQSNVVWYKNKFTATDNEYLAAVSTYFNKNTDWQLSVYVNNKVKHTQSGSATPSYKTIDLDKLIKLNSGDVFEIVFKITVDNEACVPISEFVSLNTEFYSENLSYISYDGKNWNDLYNLVWAYSSHTYASQVACIKAFTVLNPIGTSIELEVAIPYNPAQFTAIVKDQYGNLVKNGKVSFTIGLETYDVAVVNGIANLDYLFDSVGSKTIVAKYIPVTDGYLSSTASANVTVLDKVDAALSASKITAVYGSGAEFVATLTGVNGNPISGAYVNLVIGRDSTVVNTTLVTDVNGQIRFAAAELNPKVYYATVSFAGNRMYNPCVKDNVKVYIKKIDTALTAPDVTAIFDNGGLLVVTLKDVNGKAINKAKIYITINGVTSTLKTNSAGKVKLSTNGLAIGSYVAEIVYKASTYYYASNATANVIITDRISTVLSASPITTVYGSGAEFVATLTDVSGNPISGADVNLAIGRDSTVVNTTLVTDVNGQIRFDAGSLNPKVYYANVSFSGSSAYNPTEKEHVKVYVKKIDTTLSAPDVSVVYGSGNLVATLKDVKGNAISNAKVYVTVDGVIKTLTTNSNGKATFSTKSLSVGSHVAEIEYKASTYYYASNTVANVIILENINTVLSASPITTVYGSGAEFVATLTDVNGNPISGADVNLAIGRDSTVVNTTLVTDVNGQIRFDAGSLNPKVYYANVSFSGSSAYNPSVKEHVKVYVKKIDTTLIAPDVTAIYDNGGELVATLKDVKGQAIKNEKVYITINGVTSTLKTNSAGQVKLSTDGLAIGSYVAEIVYKASTYYYASNTNANVIIVDNINTVLSASPITTVYGSGAEFVATLTDVNGNPISGADVNLAIGRDSTVVNTTLVTDVNGQIRFDAGSLNPKVYYANVSYSGNNAYNPTVIEHVKVYVKKIDTSLTAPNVSAAYGSGNLVVTLKDVNGNAISNAKVYVTVDGVKTTLTTNSNGKVIFSTKSLSVGSHVAEIEYDASTYYYASSTTANITITD